MRRTFRLQPYLLATAAAVSLSALAFSAFARPQGGGGDKKAADKKAGDAKAGAEGVRRDPKGVQGISPFWEEANKGHRSMIARDFPAAVTNYRSAVSKDPENPLGHYFLGAAQQEKGDLKEAEASWQNALRFAKKKPTLRAKVMFRLADLKERQKQLVKAKAGWEKYAAVLKSQPKAKGFTATPPARLDAIAKQQAITKKYALVKKRIADRIKEVEAKEKGKKVKK